MIFATVLAVVSWFARIFDFMFLKILSPGFGVSTSSFPYFFKILKASSRVVGSGESGPEAIELKSSPRTSEMTRFRQVAG